MMLAVLRLLFPENLPTDRDSLAFGASFLVRRGLGDVVLYAGQRERARSRAALFSTLGRNPLGPNDSDAASAEYDGHFGVERVNGHAGEVFLSGLLLSHLDVLDHVERMGTSLSSDQWHDLMCAPAALFDLALGRPAFRHRWSAPRQCAEYLPLERWHRGHRHFFTLIQAVSVSLGGLLRAAGDDDVPAMHEWVVLATPLVLSSAAALWLTADFDPVDYPVSVRPTMVPPHVGPGFSGLQTRDHRHLVWLFRQLRRMRPALEPVDKEYAEFVAAVERLYDAHAAVCARFDGASLPSLRMATRSRFSRTGVDIVREFGARRLALIADRGRE